MDDDIIKCIKNRDGKLLEKICAKLHHIDIPMKTSILNNLYKNDYYYLIKLFMINPPDHNHKKFYLLIKKCFDNFINHPDIYIQGWFIILIRSYSDWYKDFNVNKNDLLIKIKNIKGRYLFKQYFYLCHLSKISDNHYFCKYYKANYIFKKYNLIKKQNDIFTIKWNLRHIFYILIKSNIYLYDKIKIKKNICRKYKLFHLFILKKK